ncbi:MAG: lamin tail domain-containing protein [Myxococcales bacterium]|nr:lamin tail domain-containing protein [Myxococcales bacterium]
MSIAPPPPRPLARRLGVAPLASLALVALAACNGDDTTSESDTSSQTMGCEANLGAGDLVITEIMADPQGADDGREWFEIYNPGDTSVNLQGVVLAISKANGDSLKSHTISVAVDIAPGQYMTFGDVLPEALPSHVDYGYASDLGSMNNTAGLIQVVCGDVLVDDALFSDVKQGYSRTFTGKLSPDATANDDQNNWCLAPEVYDQMNKEFGTPRAPNSVCPPPPPPEGQCWDGDLLRPINPAGAGDLVLSEFHANPKVVDDADGEWLEITATASVDLNGLTLGKTPGDVLQSLAAADFPTCLPVSEGDKVVFARKLDGGINGGIPQVDHVLSFSLSNSGSGLFVGSAGGDVIDAITYASTSDGAASSLDPAFLSADANDDPNAWCPAVDPYGDGDLGTPGGDNPACPQPPPEDQCQENGEWRDIKFPMTGDLVITEILPDPAAVPDEDGEWIELYVGADVDLNRLTLGKDPGSVLQILGSDDPTCMSVAAGSYIVLARNSDTAANGGLPEPTYPLGFSLTNSGGPLWIALPGPDDVTPGDLLDETSYGASKAGYTHRLDPSQLNPLANDDPMNWCDADDAEVYGAGDHGTPGAVNGSCMIVDPNLCNDGGNMRAPVAPGPGDLVITEYMPDPKAVADASGEWFEILVNADVDLNNLQLGKQPDKVEATLLSPDCLKVSAGSYIVFAHSDDPMVNGGLPQVDFTFGFSLVNSTGGIFAGINDMVITEVDYPSSTSGVAASLDPNMVDWCQAVDPYGLGDLGTPGMANPMCGMMPPDNQCLDNGVPRAIVPADVGDLVISEFLADPKVVSDTAGEWFEVVATKAVDLNGLKSAKTSDLLANAPALVDENCLAVMPGDRILFAHETDTLLNGGLPPVDHTFGWSLTNSSGGVAIGVGNVIVDTVTYAKTQAAGKTTALDPGSYDASLNDNADAIPWCVATQPYGDGDLGTPKEMNLVCG